LRLFKDVVNHGLAVCSLERTPASSLHVICRDVVTNPQV
jgi:hypothetical protein